MARPYPSVIAQIIGEFTAAARRDSSAGSVLLARYAATRDEDAFRGLVQFYAPVVWNICHRSLRDVHDVEDAFQATFLVLSRKAHRIDPPERLSSWLHGAAAPQAAGPRPVVPSAGVLWPI
jgi:Sigma-70 region 2